MSQTVTEASRKRPLTKREIEALKKSAEKRNEHETRVVETPETRA